MVDETAVQMKSTDIKILREKLVSLNEGKCPILDKVLPLEYFALDHVHKSKKADKPSIENGGYIRDSIDARANILLGKVENSFVFTGLYNEGYSLSEILRRMADYVEKFEERGEYYKDEEGNYYIHPSEKVPDKKLTLTSYNKLVKELNLIGYKNKIPTYNRSKKPSQTLTQALEKLYKLVDLEPEFYT